MTPGRRRPELHDLIPVPRFLGGRPETAHPLRGVDPGGRPVTYEVSQADTLLLFLSTSCDGCRDLWSVFADRSSMPAAVRILFVTRPPEAESAAAVARHAGPAAVVMGDEPWQDYAVHAAPFFVFVRAATATVATEGVAWSPEQIVAAVDVARAVS